MTNVCKMSGTCCRLFFINISKEEYYSGKYKTQFEEYGIVKDWKTAKSSGAHFLKRRKDGSCIYLKNDMCSIHKSRPKVCKGFFCTSKAKKWKEMVKHVDTYHKQLKNKRD